MTQWLIENWFNLFGSAGIAGLWFAILSQRQNTRTQRIANLLTISASHREIWYEVTRSTLLARVLDQSVDTSKQPISFAEEMWVGSVISHVNTVFYAMRSNEVIKLEGFTRDVAEFLALPIPREIWNKIKVYQNEEFVNFVESCKKI